MPGKSLIAWVIASTDIFIRGSIASTGRVEHRGVPTKDKTLKLVTVRKDEMSYGPKGSPFFIACNLTHILFSNVLAYIFYIYSSQDANLHSFQDVKMRFEVLVAQYMIVLINQRDLHLACTSHTHLGSWNKRSLGLQFIFGLALVGCMGASEVPWLNEYMAIVAPKQNIVAKCNEKRITTAFFLFTPTLD